jgi:hypothetical protein
MKIKKYCKIFAEKPRGFAEKPRGFAEKPRGFAEKPRGFAGVLIFQLFVLSITNTKIP